MADREIPEDRLVLDPSGSAGLFIGVSTFEDGRIVPVPYAVDDAVDLAHRFVVTLGRIEPARTTLLASDEPKKQKSRDRLAELVALGVARRPARLGDVYDALEELSGRIGPRGLAVLSFATHGLSEEGGDFLLASDSRRRRQLEMGVKVPQVFDDLARAVEDSGSGRALVLLDACRNRFLRGRRDHEPEGAPMSASFAKAIARVRGVAVLAGAPLGGFSYDDLKQENGVFTAAVLAGLEGQAKPGPEGWITLGTLSEFVDTSVAAWVRRNVPEDAGKSRGIELRLEPSALGLPLAPHPEASRERARYRERREKALDKVKDNLGDVLDGSHWNQVRALLTAGQPTSAANRLLDRIEGLNGSELAQLGLKEVLRKMAEGGKPPMAPAPPIAVPTAPVQVKPLPAAPPQALEPRQLPNVPGRAAWVFQRRTLRWLISIAWILALGMVGNGIRVWIKQSAQEIVPAPPEPREVSGSSSTEEPANPKAGDAWITPAGIRFHFVPGGTYTIGSPATEPGRGSDENQRKVELPRGVWLAETELTQAQWSRMAPGKPPWKFANCGADCPVESVTWFAAAEFANRLSARENLALCYGFSGCTGTIGDSYDCEVVSSADLACPGYRLPSEAEWEVAARAVAAGSTVSEATYNGDLDRIAWYNGNSGSKTHPVGKKSMNTWGFYDLLGNVWEWTDDTPNVGWDWVVRGGSWDGAARLVRAACRGWIRPGSRVGDLGFRLARGQGLRSGR